MQSNLSITPYKPTFGIKTSNSVINVAKGHCLNRRKPNFKRFNEVLEKINVMERTFGFDNYTIACTKSIGNRGKSYYKLYAYKNDGESINKNITLIRTKTLQQAISQFLNLTKYDLLLKLK